VVPTLINQTQGVLRQHGLFGDLVHVGSVAVAFAAFVYDIMQRNNKSTMLTVVVGLPPSVLIWWTATEGSATANDVAAGLPLPKMSCQLASILSTSGSS
jgi:hypothetical protein